MGAAYLHVYWGLLQAAEEEARLQEDGDAGEPLLPDAEPALNRRVAVCGPQRPVVGGCRSEVKSVDSGRGMGRVQGCVPPVRQRVVQLCLLRNHSERLHGGGPQVDVALSTQQGPRGVFCRTVSWDTTQSALCSNASPCRKLAPANQNGCSVCCWRTRRLS